MTLQQLTLYSIPVEDIKPNRWITLSEQYEFSGFLSSLGVNVDGLDSCANKWERYHCSSDSTHSTKLRYLSCSKRGVCPRCSMAYASQRAGLMYQWIKQNLSDRLDFDLKLNQIVLTLPQSLHDIDKKKFSKMIKKFMSKLSIEAYGYCIQTRHSADPLKEKYVHCHILSLNMRKGENRIVEGKYYFDVDKMRDDWKEIIEKETSVSVEGSVNLHTEYASVLHDKNKVLHILAYLYRYPIQDLFNVQVRNKSLNYVQCPQFEKNSTLDGVDLKMQEVRSKVMDLIGEEKSRIVWCGLLTSARRKELIQLILNEHALESLDDMPKYVVQVDELGKPSFIWKSLSDLEKEARKRAKECRDCGSQYEDKPFDVGFYEGDNEPFSSKHNFSDTAKTDITRTNSHSLESLETNGRASLNESRLTSELSGGVNE